MIFQFKLDNVIVKEPLNWENFSVGYERIIDSRGALIPRLDGELTFWDDAYDRIKTEWETNGACGSLELTIEYKKYPADSFTEIGNGYTVRVIDCTFDHDRCLVTVAEVRDNGYMSKINANADIKAKIDVGRSKNDEDITAEVPTVNTIRFFDATGGNIYTNRKTYTVYDVLEYLVAFCSDGGVTFDSTYFGSGGDGEHYEIITGKALATGNTTDPPTLSFTEVFEELHKIFNVVVVIDDSGAIPEIRVESAATTYNEVVLLPTYTGDQIRGLKQRFIPFSAGNAIFNGDKPLAFFSVLKIGSETTETGNYPDIEWRAWDEEEYLIRGDCAAKQELDLVGSWVRDSNTILNILGGTTTNDSAIIIFEKESLANDAQQYDVIAPGLGTNISYNDGITNSSIAPRFLGAVPNSIAAYLGDGNDGFRATDSVATPSTNGRYAAVQPAVITFDNETSDPNNNYDPLLFRYTAPSNGLYIFKTEVQVTVNTLPPIVTEVDCTLYIRRFTLAGYPTVIQEYSRFLSITTVSQNVITIEDASFYLNSGEIVEVWFEATDNQGGPPHATFDTLGIEFETTQVSTGGGIYQTYDPGDFRGNFWMFEVPMSYEDYLDRVSYPNRFDAIFINRGGVPDDITGWIIKSQYKFGKDSGIAVFELVSAGS